MNPIYPFSPGYGLCIAGFLVLGPHHPLTYISILHACHFQITQVHGSSCWDSMSGDGALGVYGCHHLGGNQVQYRFVIIKFTFYGMVYTV